ncbi:uncharacterized protein LOC116619419 isoform X1 [Nematostella vectensis]|uniref:uncharacterized protein LOC116619419 isoform X1 n=1 Tax=Nematostella vectensis TaxID=45351 RepID=UPI002077841C|nr:uncharacterized protein LOC116619419 isoform X1 [Nematostella vectensis]
MHVKPLVYKSLSKITWFTKTSSKRKSRSKNQVNCQVSVQRRIAMKAVIVICLLLVIAGSSNAQYVSTFGDEPMPEQPLNQRPRESAKNYKQRARLEKLLPRRLWKDQY